MDIKKSISAQIRALAPEAPPAWLFSRSKIAEVNHPSILAQLPRSYRLFVKWLGVRYSKDANFRIVKGGGYAFVLAKKLCNEEDLVCFKINIRGRDLFVDLRDARFVSVIAEMRSGHVYDAVSRFISEGDTLVDVGANQGAYSVVGSWVVGKGGTVVSIEPQTALAKVVEASLKMSPVENWSVLNAAAGDEVGKLDFYVSKHYSGTGGLYEEWSGRGEAERYVVPIVRIDDSVAWQDFTGRVFMKLDCEGAELQALRGSMEMISARRPLIYMEMNPKAMAAAGTTLDEFREQFTVLGYDSYETTSAVGERKPLASLHTEHQYDIILRDADWPTMGSRHQ